MRRWIVIGILLGGLQGFSMAASSDDLIGAIKERAQLMSELERLLRDEDGNIRLAAFDEGMRSDSVHVRSTTMELALGSDDERLQTAALRHLIDTRDRFLVDVKLPENPSEQQEEIYKRHAAMEIGEVKLNEDSDEIDAQYWQGHLVRGGFVLRGLVAANQGCKLSVQIASGTTLVGALECDPRLRGRASLPIVIELS